MIPSSKNGNKGIAEGHQALVLFFVYVTVINATYFSKVTTATFLVACQITILFCDELSFRTDHRG